MRCDGLGDDLEEDIDRLACQPAHHDGSGRSRTAGPDTGAVEPGIAKRSDKVGFQPFPEFLVRIGPLPRGEQGIDCQFGTCFHRLPLGWRDPVQETTARRLIAPEPGRRVVPNELLMHLRHQPLAVRRLDANVLDEVEGTCLGSHAGYDVPGCGPGVQDSEFHRPLDR